MKKKIIVEVVVVVLILAAIALISVLAQTPDVYKRQVYKNRQRDLQSDRTDPLHRCEVELVSRRGPENRELMVGYLLLCGLQCRHSLLHQSTVDHGCG